MRILVLNCGSSTLKFQIIETAADLSAATGSRKLARGVVDRIGGAASFRFETGDSVGNYEAGNVRDHKDAIATVLDRTKLNPDLKDLDAVGHRVVHGGDQFTASTRIDEHLIDALDSLCEIAPLHNPASVSGIRAARSILGEATPMVACFDTSFHQTIPEHAATYAIPRELSNKYRIRRYGFHGLAHEYSLLRYSELQRKPTAAINIITVHLGNGCSACAIQGGKSTDTSMGFTPLEGLVMGTRSGDLDPALVAFLAEKEAAHAGEVESWLNKRSGLLGVSGLSSDMRELVAAFGSNEQARLAVEVFCYRARKYLGAYLAALGGAEAVVFSGGIGENSPLVREKICAGMDWCGLVLDKDKNAALTGAEGRISPSAAQIHAYVIPSDEEAVIARETARLVSEK